MCIYTDWRLVGATCPYLLRPRWLGRAERPAVTGPVAVYFRSRGTEKGVVSSSNCLWAPLDGILYIMCIELVHL